MPSPLTGLVGDSLGPNAEGRFGNASLTELNLGGNSDLGAEGAMVLAQALMRNNGLAQLTLSDCQ
eukprot:2038458-Pyramimonas_sp.AAC.1